VGHVGKWGIAGEQWCKYVDYYNEYSGWDWKVIDGKLWHITQKNEKDAIEFLRHRDTRKPFFLNVAFYALHAQLFELAQYEPQPWSKVLYDDVTIPEPVTNTEEDWLKMPSFFHSTSNQTLHLIEENFDRFYWHARFYNSTIFQWMIRKTYRMATELDYTSGVILDELKRQGIYDNTFIIFTGDNGVFHGEHGLAEKLTPHEESLRTPLIIRDPRTPKHLRGTTIHEFTLNIDLAPTILNAAGLSRPDVYMGQNIADLYLDKNVTWRKDFYYEFLSEFSNPKYMPQVEALVNEEYKYFYWSQFDYEQLFHVSIDKYEQVDILNSTERPYDAKTKKIHIEMKRRMSELRSLVRAKENLVL